MSVSHEMPAPVSKQETKDAIMDLFHRCDAPMTVLEFDEELRTAAREKIRQLGCTFDATTAKAVEAHLAVGVYSTVGFYPHVKDMVIRTFMTAYTALISLIDDYFADKPGPINEFNSRFVRGKAQDHPLLEAFARLLHEFHKYWNPIMADMLQCYSLAFITALAIEYRLQCATILNGSQLARVVRNMSGISGLYSLWMFPTNASPDMFLSALPPMIRIFNHGNDVLSFYKEELAGETSNYISICARVNRTNKLDELKKTVDETVDAYQQVEKLARTFPNVHGTYMLGWAGHLRFYLSLTRYRISELFEAN
ncbi:hypothetical protein AX15_000833 [Amanita polypyramis BW_CC]|nr:hypothetical protein AX15_000833 [Amanita polypyramis BW_CC]